MESELTLDRLSDDELRRRLDELVSRSRRIEADLVAHIGEVERRKLYARAASPSMFAYCRERLHLSEAEADGPAGSGARNDRTLSGRS